MNFSFSFFPLLRKWFTWDVEGKKYLFIFFFLEPDIQPHPSCYMYYYSVSEKSYNFLHLTRHRRLINFICAGLNLFPQTSLRMSSKAESWPSSRLITTRSLKSRAAALLPKLKILLEEKKGKSLKVFPSNAARISNGRVLLLWRLMKTFFSSHCRWFITAAHLQSEERGPAVIMGCMRAAVTTSKSPPPPHSPLLPPVSWLEPDTSCIICPGRKQKEGKKYEASVCVRVCVCARVCFSPPEFLSQHLSLTLMSRLSVCVSVLHRHLLVAAGEDHSPARRCPKAAGKQNHPRSRDGGMEGWKNSLQPVAETVFFWRKTSGRGLNVRREAALH